MKNASTPRTRRNTQGVVNCADVRAYLHAVHLELANNLDGNFTHLAFKIASAVDVTERAVTHFLNQLPPIESLVLWEFAPARSLLGHQLVDIVHTSLLVAATLHVLLVLVTVCGDTICASCSVGIVDGSGGVGFVNGLGWCCAAKARF